MKISKPNKFIKLSGKFRSHEQNVDSKKDNWKLALNPKLYWGRVGRKGDYTLAHRNVVAAYNFGDGANYSWLLLVTIFVLSTTTNKSQE